MKEVTDQALLAQLNSDSGGGTSATERPSNNKSLSENLRSMFANALSRQLGQIGQYAASSVLPDDVAKGFGNAVPQSLLSGIRGAGQLFDQDLLPEIEEQSPESFGEAAGQVLGKATGYGALASPFIAAGEAAIPGVIGSLLGSGTAGAVLSPTGERLEGAAEFAAPVAAGKALAPVLSFGGKSLGAALRKVTPKKTYTKIQDQYDAIKNSLQDIFQFVEKQSEERGIKNVGELNDDIFDTAIEYGPRTKSFKLLIDRARKGDYKDVRRFYSKAGEISRKSGKANDWEKKEIFDEIQHDINDGLSEHFKNTGHSDLAQWLDAAKNGWRQMIDTFEKHPSIRELVGDNKLVPSTLNPLTEDSVRMRKLLKANPDVAADIEAIKQKEAFKKAWEKTKKRAITAGGLALGSKFLNQGNQSER